MALPEYVAPVLAVAGFPAVLFVILRYFPQTVRALMLAVAGIVAIRTRDENRRKASLEIVDKVTRTDSEPRAMFTKDGHILQPQQDVRAEARDEQGQQC
jgi:hypothetical protein